MTYIEQALRVQGFPYAVFSVAFHQVATVLSTVTAFGRDETPPSPDQQYLSIASEELITFIPEGTKVPTIPETRQSLHP